MNAKVAKLTQLKAHITFQICMNTTEKEALALNLSYQYISKPWIVYFIRLAIRKSFILISFMKSTF